MQNAHFPSHYYRQTVMLPAGEARTAAEWQRLSAAPRGTWTRVSDATNRPKGDLLLLTFSSLNWLHFRRQKGMLKIWLETLMESHAEKSNRIELQQLVHITCKPEHNRALRWTTQSLLHWAFEGKVDRDDSYESELRTHLWKPRLLYVVRQTEIKSCPQPSIWKAF